MEIAHCGFFYLDKFVLLASGRHVLLYQYQIDRLSKDALIRQHPKGKCKMVHSWDHAGQKVTSFDAFNNVLSHTIISAGSDRSLTVLDAATGKVARILADAHSKPIHTVALPKPSPLVSLSPLSYDNFATGRARYPIAGDMRLRPDTAQFANIIFMAFLCSASTDNVVYCWDVRADVSRIMALQDHVNRREKVGLAYSPCMRYLAVGSEERTCEWTQRDVGSMDSSQGMEWCFDWCRYVGFPDHGNTLFLGQYYIPGVIYDLRTSKVMSRTEVSRHWHRSF